MAQLQNELAERELIKQFRHDNSWLSVIRPKQNWVSNDVIKIPVQGGDPTVLINNSIYPISGADREDGFITMSLNKYDTTNTTVSADELYALPYEKVSDVQMQHRTKLEQDTAKHALHSLAIAAHGATTPVIECTGPADPVTGRIRLSTKDLIREWELLGNLLVPLEGRHKVLSVEHAADLMLEDSTRNISWGQQWLKGKVPVEHAGYTLWVAAYTPKYELVGGVWTKKAYGSLGGNTSSITFYEPNTCKATGTVEAFYRASKDDPENRRNTIGFRLWFIAVGMKDEGFAATVSPTV